VLPTRDERVIRARRTLEAIDRALASGKPIATRLAEARPLFDMVPEADMPNRGSKAIYRELRRSALGPWSAAIADEAEIRWMRERIARALELTAVWG
jgi:hypothetical protein